MDGLSAAASGIAVVSLAIQLVDSVREIRRFLRDVSEAPKELKRLIDLLEQLELILENIAALVDRQKQGAAQTDIDLSGSILRAMETCESKLKMLEDVTRTFGSFRLACKKRDIEDFERQLHDAISMLNLAMTTNLTIVHSHGFGHLLEQVTATNQMTTTISKNLLLLTNGSSTDTNYGLSATATARIRGNRGDTKVKLSKRQSITFSSFSGPFGRLMIRREAQDSVFEDEKGSSDISHAQSKSTWVFMPSFLSYAFDFQYLNTCGYVERTLRTYSVVQDNHPIWVMCWEGDLKGIQKLLSDREISPFSVNQRGRTLLHVSADWCQAEVCNFFFELGYTGRETDFEGRPVPISVPPHQPRSNPTMKFKDVERTYEIISCRSHGLDSTYYQNYLFSAIHHPVPVDFLTRIVLDWVTKENVNDYHHPPLAIAAKKFGNSAFSLRHLWKPIIHHLIRLGANLQRGRWSRYTIIEHIMNDADSAYGSKCLGLAWLDLLMEVRINVVEYLRTVYNFHFDVSTSLPMLQNSYYSDFRARYLIISEEPPSISWDWFIEAGGNAFEVLEEFKNFGPGRHLTVVDYNQPGSMYNWPYSYPVWQWCVEMKRFGGAGENQMAAVQKAEDRYERRWHKKALKLARAQGIVHRGPKMPGAWVD
ncbi:hypothetical protein N431DRAFT_385949 [Stipitochalara longipes BDJ]|nr:hypothetical protein N431DRAFT_385949 [Stipitochalara longipes BDJ]